MKRLVQGVALAALFAFLTVGRLSSHSPHEEVFTKDGLLAADAGQLEATVVTPHLEAPIAKGRNVLWCSMFQISCILSKRALGLPSLLPGTL